MHCMPRAIGMDDNWQACGAGINGSFHAKDGTPLWNTTRFPNVKAMNDRIHKLGLKSDWWARANLCCGCAWRAIHCAAVAQVHKQLHLLRERQAAPWTGGRRQRASTASTGIRWSQDVRGLALPVLLSECPGCFQGVAA
jgi:hypothetical protein